MLIKMELNFYQNRNRFAEPTKAIFLLSLLVLYILKLYYSLND